MSKGELLLKLSELDIPATDDDGLPIYIPPDDRLRNYHGLDTSYYRMDFMKEGLSTHPDSRICSPGDIKMQAVLKNIDVPYRLFRSAIELFSSSIEAYFDQDERPQNLKCYPASILTFWSGFETLVRFMIEKLVSTTRDIPIPITEYLLEIENQVDKSGTIKSHPRYRPVLDRYSIFLKYAYGLSIDRGSKTWQNLAQAQELRDYYTHLNVNVARSTKSSEVLTFMESILVGLIWPSCLVRKTIYLEVYELYFLWKVLYEASSGSADHIEEPFLKSSQVESWEMFHCNFDNVDSKKYPNSKEQMDQLGLSR